MTRIILATGTISDLALGSLSAFHAPSPAATIGLFLAGLGCSALLLFAYALAEALELPESSTMPRRSVERRPQ